MRLHYIYDPLCGWCYAAAPLVAVAQALPDVQLVLHGGGLFAEPTVLAPGMRQHIRAADGRIAALSGQPFGSAYLDGLLGDPRTSLHSAPPIAAILAVETLQVGAGPAMLKAIQHAHYVDGRRVVETPVLADLAAQLGLAREAVTAAMGRVPVDAHVAETRRLMAAAGVGGFPALVAEADGRFAVLPASDFYGRPEDFQTLLTAHRAAV